MFRIEADGSCCVGQDVLVRNVAHSQTLGLRTIEGPTFADSGPLAVVGGGHSAHDQLDTLRAWPGKIWAINGACRWLKSQGIDSILFSVDPEACLAEHAEGVTQAILASHCAPEAFAALKGAEILMFHSAPWKGVNVKKPLIGGTTSATRVPLPALMLGHSEIHFFGCEGSFRRTSHTFKDEWHPKQLIIRAGGEDYVTTLQFMVQSENLAKLIAKFPRFKDRSGGLLSAMLEHPDTWEVVALWHELAAEIDPSAITEENRYVA